MNFVRFLLDRCFSRAIMVVLLLLCLMVLKSSDFLPRNTLHVTSFDKIGLLKNSRYISKIDSGVSFR